MFEGSGQAEGDFFHGAANEFFGGAGNVPGQVQFLGENVGGASGQKRKGNAMAVFLGGEAVDDFIEGAVAAAGDDQAAAFVCGIAGDFSGVAGAGGFGEVGFDAATGENAARFIEQAAAAGAAVAGVGVVDQKSVSQSKCHCW